MKTIIFFSIENWDNVWRRNQPLCYEFVRLDPEVHILFVGPPVSYVEYMQHRFFRKRSVLEARVTLLNFVKVLPDRFWFGRFLNQLIYEFQLRIFTGNKTSDAILYAKTEYYADLISRIPKSKLIYDNGDDWASAHANVNARNVIIRNDRWMSTYSDAVICVSRRLCELRSSAGARNTHLIPNGVFVDRYSKCDTDVQPDCKSVGYVGTMHPDRFDIDYVLTLAKLLQNVTILLAGPFLFPKEVIGKVTSVNNIKLVGIVAFDDVPKFLKGCEFLIHPHIVSEFTESLQPIKLWEYFATGREIVSTNVAGFREYSDLVHICDTPMEAAEVISNQNMGVDISREKRRIEIANDNSWEVRALQIMDLMWN